VFAMVFGGMLFATNLESKKNKRDEIGEKIPREKGRKRQAREKQQRRGIVLMVDPPMGPRPKNATGPRTLTREEKGNGKSKKQKRKGRVG